MDAMGLYVHVPFCRTKCGYCDFFSVPGSAGDVSRTVRALCRELVSARVDPEISPATVFLGGGTPTLLPEGDLDRLLACVQGRLRAERVGEFTVEANPATLDRARAGLLRRYGVDRISLGAQSFDSRELAVLERIHRPEDIAPSVRTAREVGFGRLNLDLIFGIPGQTLPSWAESLHRAIDLGPDHLACYGLTYEPGTALTVRRDRREIIPCDEELEAEMFLLCIDTLAEAGYEHYEISNYAKPGHRCRHNLDCWRGRPYLGIGPSAASYLNGERSRNVADLERYVTMIETTGSARVERERLSGTARAGEFAMLGLRMIDGIDVAEFKRKTGFDPFVLFREQIDGSQEMGLLTLDPPGETATEGRIRLTRRGLLVGDAVMSEFVCPNGSAA